MKKILQFKEKPAPRSAPDARNALRTVAAAVPLADIKTAKIRTVLREMSAALASQDDGVAIAAPQIGYGLRIFVVSGKVFAPDFSRNRAEKILLAADAPASKRKEIPADLAFINPVISKLSREKDWVPEGCLSVRWLYGKALRSKKATVEAYDENGKKFTRGASGLLAQIFQHETDHLDGILFIDHAKDVKEELPRQR